jgi:hypothetical protein
VLVGLVASQPLLPSIRLLQCSACSEHVKLADSQCPHCGAAIAVPGTIGRVVLTAAAVVGMLSSRVSEPDYGVPVTDSITATDTEDTAATDGDSSTGAPTGSATETGEVTETDTGSSDDTGTTSMPEPEYGVPSTTAGESDYGMPAM